MRLAQYFKRVMIMMAVRVLRLVIMEVIIQITIMIHKELKIKKRPVSRHQVCKFRKLKRRKASKVHIRTIQKTRETVETETQ